MAYRLIGTKQLSDACILLIRPFRNKLKVELELKYYNFLAKKIKFVIVIWKTTVILSQAFQQSKTALAICSANQNKISVSNWVSKAPSSYLLKFCFRKFYHFRTRPVSGIVIACVLFVLSVCPSVCLCQSLACLCDNL